SPLIARLLNDASLTRYVAFVAIVIFFQAYYPIYVQFLSGMHQFTRQALVTSLYAVIKLISALGLLLVLGVYGAFSGFAVGGIIAALIGRHWTRDIGGNKKKHLPLKSFLSFAGLYVAILMGLQLLMSLDLFMVKALLRNDVQAGYYNAATSLARISYLLLQGLTFVLLPSVSALTRPGASHVEATEFIKETMRYLIALIVPSVVIGAATSKSLLLLFFFSTREYVAAAPVLTVLMIGIGALGFYLLLANIVAGAGRAKIGFYITASMIAASALLGWFLIPQFGLIGAAWQTTLVSGAGLLVLGTYTFKVFRIPFPLKSVLNVLIATFIAVLPTYFWQASVLLLPVLYIVLFAVYILVLLFLGEISYGDRSRLARLHPKLSWLAR
ncbi:MAG: polysaccharide biosynthesis C-terminal domain-containing protein, partial [Acidobacteriota bacterium]